MPIDVKYIMHMGNDRTAYNAARTSYDRADWDKEDTLNLSELRLVTDLAENRHWTPFGHAHVTLWIQAPIFCRAQLIRSKIGLTMTPHEDEDEMPISEMSRRVVKTRPSYTLPHPWHLAPRRGMGTAGPIPPNEVAAMKHRMERAVENAINAYMEAIVDGIAPEEARAILPQCIDTSWIWTGSLEAWSRVCKLRLESHAQNISQELARLINKKIEPLFPESWPRILQTAL